MSKSEGKLNHVAYCGLYCGDCPWHLEQIADLSRDLRKELRKSAFDKVAPLIAEYPHLAVYKNYPQFIEVLTALMKGRCKKICKHEKGHSWCKVRRCCQKKGIAGCWECEAFEGCGKLDFLKNGHGDAHLKNLWILREKGVDAFIAGRKYWYTEIKS